MPIVTIIQCDCCGKRIEIFENKETPGAEEVLNVIDAMSKKLFFCTIECLRKWAAKYVCPYKESPRSVVGEADEFLPGLN